MTNRFSVIVGVVARVITGVGVDLRLRLWKHDVVDGIELPQPEAEFHTDSGDDPGDDSDDHSGDDSDDDGQLVSHLYPFMCQIDHRVSLVTPASPFLE